MSTSTHVKKPGDLGQSALQIDGHNLKLEDIEAVARQNRPVELSELAQKQLSASRQVVEQLLSEGKVVYGITTGFGKFKDVYIAPEDTIKLQRNFMLSHAVGVGPCLR